MAASRIASASGNAIDGGDVTVTFPGGIQENDFVLAFGGHPRFTAANPSVSTAGYAVSTKFGSNTAPGRSACYASKFMTATPDTGFTGVGSGDALDAAAYVALIFRGVDLTTPFDVTPVVSNGASTGTPNSPSITPVTDGCAIISFGFTRVNDLIVTMPAGYGDLVIDGATDTTSCASMGAWKILATAAPEDPAAWGGLASTGHCSCTIALRPATAGGIIVPRLSLVGVGV